MGSYIMLCIPPLSRLARCACSYYLSYLFFCIILLIDLNFKNGCKDTEKSRQYKILRPFFCCFCFKSLCLGKAFTLYLSATCRWPLVQGIWILAWWNTTALYLWLYASELIINNFSAETIINCGKWLISRFFCLILHLGIECLGL